MRQLFLFGGMNDDFASATRPFVEAAGGGKARIALLFPMGGPGWDRYLGQYQEPWFRMGVPEVVPVHPVGDTTELDAEALAALASCTGIFMCGGDNRRYQALYATGAAREILRDAYRRGVPYAGLSAGAVLTAETALIKGNRLTTATNRLCLRVVEGAPAEELATGPGLGLLPGMLVEAHFSELGSFPRLIAGMEQTGAPLGLGLDEQIWAEVRDERQIHIDGVGRAYLVKRLPGGTFEVTPLAPGQTITCP